ncbi:MAG: class I SAM-dependent methyltransferase [Coriobacteriales bacterium]
MAKKKKRIFSSRHSGYVTPEGMASTIVSSSEDIGTVGEPVPKHKAEGENSPEDERVRELQNEVQAEAARLEAERRAAAQLAELKAREAESVIRRPQSDGSSHDSQQAARHAQHRTRASSGVQGRYAHIGEVQSSFGESRYAGDSRRDQRGAGEREQAFADITDVRLVAREPQASTEREELVNWKARLARESPLYSRAFSLCNARSVLELGSGNGQRSVMFAEWGLDVTGADYDQRNVEKARALSEQHRPAIVEAGGKVRFAQASIDNATDVAAHMTVDAVVCVGDVLSRVSDLEQLRRVLRMCFDVLEPGGVLVIDVVNNTHYIQSKIRSTKPEVYETVEGTKVFLDVMDYPAGSTMFNVDALTLTRDSAGEWSMQSQRSQHLYISSAGITHELFDAGFDVQEISGDYTGSELRRDKDLRIVVVARRKRHRTV